MRPAPNEALHRRLRSASRRSCSTSGIAICDMVERHDAHVPDPSAASAPSSWLRRRFFSALIPSQPLSLSRLATFDPVSIDDLLARNMGLEREISQHIGYSWCACKGVHAKDPVMSEDINQLRYLMVTEIL